MFIRKQDLSVLLFYYLGYSRIRSLIFRLQHRPVARFITFHDIIPESVKCFKSKLHFLKQYTNVVSFDDFFSGRLSLEKVNVVITFDDGYKSWVSSAVPSLKDLELPATFFVSSGFVGLSKEDGAEFMRSKLYIKLGTDRTTGCLKYEDVRKIVEEGYMVGGHTINHCNLAELRAKRHLQYEISEDKKRLETITGSKVKYFSYPGGNYLNPVIHLPKVLKDAGYIGAVTTVSGLNHVDSSPYLLRRELTRASMPNQVFKARVYGNYDASRYIKQQILKIVKSKNEKSAI